MKAYSPPADIEIQLETIFETVLGSTSRQTKLDDINQKFNLFQSCSKKIEHSIPSSMLHSIKTVEDVVTFYKTPIDSRTPLDKMRTMELPENLHVQFDYVRFHPGEIYVFHI